MAKPPSSSSHNTAFKRVPPPFQPVSRHPAICPMYRLRNFKSKIAQINEAVFLQEAPITNLQPLLNQLQVATEEIELIEVAHIAARLGRLDILQPLLNRFPPLFLRKDDRGDTPLHVAARAGQENIVNYLLNPTENGRTDEEVEDLRRRINEKENTALHEALENKHETIARLLFEGHPELLILPNDSGKTPPYLAAEAGLWNLVNDMSSLVDVNQDPIPWEGKTSLHAAITMRNPGSTCGRKSFAMAKSCFKLEHPLESLKSVLKLNPRLIQVTDSNGRNPIHYAASTGYYDGLHDLLKEHKQEAYQPDNEGIYPIHMAASNGHIKVIKLLCKECPKSWSLLSYGGRNILHVAALSNKEDVVRYILKKPEMGKLINDVDGSGNTPLHLASECRKFKVVHALTSDKRVDTSICNNNNLTARDIAEEDKVVSFRKMLTLTALRMANAPRAPKLDVFNGKHLIRKDMANARARSGRLENFRCIDVSSDDGSRRVGSNDDKLATTDHYKDRINTLLLVSTLVATVTFTAGFTIPGGSDIGTATMLHKTMFKVYVVCDAIALFCSIIAVISLLWSHIGQVQWMCFIIGFALALLGISLSLMAVAFTAGLYIVISPLHWLATAILIITLIFLICASALLLPLLLPIRSKNCFYQSISYYFMYLLVAVVGGGDEFMPGNLIAAPLGDIEQQRE